MPDSTGDAQHQQPTILGLNIGEVKTVVVEGTRRAEILQRNEMATAGHFPFDRIFPVLSGLIANTMEKARRQERQITALSVSVGGPLQIEEGRLIDPPHLPGWHGVRLKERLQERFPEAPVYVERDADAAALAEYIYGIGKGRSDLRRLVYLSLEGRLSAGLILDGRLLRLAVGVAEFDSESLGGMGASGPEQGVSWDETVAGASVLQQASRLFPERWGGRVSLHEVVAAILEDDPEALAAAAAAGSSLGRILSKLIDALHPQVVVLGAPAYALRERLLTPLRRTIALETSSQANSCEVVPAALGRSLGDVAALMAALGSPEVASAR